MPFDAKKFMSTNLVPRTALVDVPSLDIYFEEGDKLKWEVRGLTSSELSKSQSAFKQGKDIGKILEAIASNAGQIAELKAAIGIKSDTPEDVIIRLNQLEMCSVSPEIDMQVAVKLAEAYPTEFYTLTNKIIELTSLGFDLKK